MKFFDDILEMIRNRKFEFKLLSGEKSYGRLRKRRFVVLGLIILYLLNMIAGGVTGFIDNYNDNLNAGEVTDINNLSVNVDNYTVEVFYNANTNGRVGYKDTKEYNRGVGVKAYYYKDGKMVHDDGYNSFACDGKGNFNRKTTEYSHISFTFDSVEIRIGNVTSGIVNVGEHTVNAYESPSTNKSTTSQSTSDTSNANAGLSSSTVSMTTNSDGSVTYNGYYIAGNYKWTYSNYRIYEDGTTSGSATMSTI